MFDTFESRLKPRKKNTKTEFNLSLVERFRKIQNFGKKLERVCN